MRRGPAAIAKARPSSRGGPARRGIARRATEQAPARRCFSASASGKPATPRRRPRCRRRRSSLPTDGLRMDLAHASLMASVVRLLYAIGAAGTMRRRRPACAAAPRPGLALARGRCDKDAHAMDRDATMTQRRRRSPGHRSTSSARGEPVPRPQPAGRLAARLRRPGDRPGAGGGVPHRRAARRRTRCTPISSCPGDPTVPIIYEVERIRDGKSFTTRRVMAIQHGQPIFTLSASFQVEEPGLEHQIADAGRAAARGPAERGRDRAEPSCRSLPEPVRRYFERERPIELRPVDFERYLGREPAAARVQTSGSAPPAPCPTIRRSTNACSPTRRT